jgi:putative transposase
MPSKNVIKIYVPNGVYHIYNRGIEKQDIFKEDEDYVIFLWYLKSYLLPSDDPAFKNLPVGIKREILNFNLYKRIKLIAFVLMPNHFHLMLKQTDERAIIELLRRLSNAYVKYFNTKYKRIGPLFQGKYKAVLIDKESYFLHLTRYIHRNPLEILKKSTGEELIKYPFSSYPDYCGERKFSFIYKDEILDYFKSIKESDLRGFKSYRDFVENYLIDSKEILGNLIIEV